MLKRLKRSVQALLAITWVRRLHDGTMRMSSELLGAHRSLSLVYSLLSIPVFNREQFAVLRGRRNYYRNLKRTRRSRTELRRNIHRLEKGLLMQPRRSIFALDYLGETIEFYERAIDQLGSADMPGEPDRDELTWAFSVLSSYFSVVDRSHATISVAHERFERCRARFEPQDADKVPYARSSAPAITVSYEDLLAIAHRRRSVRWFEQRAVPRELVDKALLVARQAPSACNRLPYEFRIFDDPDMVRRVASIPFGTAGYAHQIPMIAVVVGRLHHYFSARDRHVIYVDSALAAMSFMLALETLGLASGAINWPDFEPLEAKMQRVLGLDYDERVVMLIAIGYADPAGLVAFSEKKPLDIIRRYNALAD